MGILEDMASWLSSTASQMQKQNRKKDQKQGSGGKKAPDAPKKDVSGPVRPVDDKAGQASAQGKNALQEAPKAATEQFFTAPIAADPERPRYWDETSPEYDPAQAFLGTDIMPTSSRQQIADDKAGYDSYMAYFNDRKANEQEYDASRLDDGQYMSQYLPWSGAGGEDLVDNGTNDVMNRTSNFITGGEAKKQAEYFGNEDLSRALSGVDDNEVISKNSLLQYGYKPFTDASSIPAYLEGKASQGASAIAEASEQAWNAVSGIRDQGTDWNVRLFDAEFSGKAVDAAIHEAREKGAGSYDELGKWMPAGIELDPPSARLRPDGLYETPADDGNVYVLDAGKFNGGGYELRYPDAVVEGKDGKEYEIPMERWADVTKDYSVAEYLAAVQHPDLSEAEKSKKADELHERMGSATDYGPLNWNAPSYMTGDALSEYAVPTLVNGALSSAAYLNPYTLAERAVLAEDLSASGLNAASQNVRDDGIITYEPAENESLNTIMGAIAPIAESKLGSLGNFGGKGFLERGAEAVTKRIPGIGDRWIGRELIPAATSEGLEENITDPLYAM